MPSATRAPAPARSQAPPGTLPRWGRREWLLASLLVGMTVAAYASVLDCEFVNYDDDVYVTQNPYLRTGLSWQGLWWGLTSFYFSNWHPLVWWSYLLDYELYGLEPAGYHVTNLLWH